MTSNGDSILNPLAPSAASAAAPSDSHKPRSRPSSPAPRRSSTTHPPVSPTARQKHPALPNGHRAHADAAKDDDVEDAQNESEAETVVLDPKDNEEQDNGAKVIKTERSDDDDNSTRLRSPKHDTHTRSPTANGRRASQQARDVKLNGTKHDPERHVKSPQSTSPKSPARSTTSPANNSARRRSSSTVESRKRKAREDSHPKSLEPPRQKAKTEGLRDLRQPTSPASPAVGRPHKRSQSTQSVVSGVPGRKRRELTSLALPIERKHWSDSSSENSSSPRPTQTPNLATQTRVKRSSHRALTSPARAMPAQGRRVDRFGATRLARESEKGDLSAVRAAYDAAPDELDKPDFAGIAPLQKAALKGHGEVVQFLINVGCQTNCESNDRDTPLIDAVENAHLEVVRLLLNQGHVNPHHQNKKGQRAIDVLDHEEDDADEIEKELQAAMRRETNTANKEDNAQSGLAQANSASRLLYNEYNTETLKEKAGDGDIQAVGELINSNIKPNIACGVAASRGGYYDILSILLASGLKADPDPSKHSETPMLVAIGRGHLKIVNLLLEQDNFNPTRRNREGKAYYEISEDRRGPKWEQERDLLKQAYDNFSTTHRSPRRAKKEPPNLQAARIHKRKTSPHRERSSSPPHEAKRPNLVKATTAPQKSRRLMSGKEMANQQVKRRRRVVDDDTSEESEDEVRAPKKAAKPRSFSEGEEHKQVKKSIKERPADHSVAKRKPRARSHDSEEENHGRKLNPKIRTKTEKSHTHNIKPAPDVESPDEHRPIKNKIKSRPLEDKMTKRRISDASTEDLKVKRPATSSTKSTPAPPEKAQTPEAVREAARERRLEEQRKEAERREAEKKEAEKREAEKKEAERKEAEMREAEEKRKAAEAEERKKAEEEAAREAARKAAEEEAARKKAQEEAEAEARRLAEEAEAKRKREEEEAEARRKQEEEARLLAEQEARRLEELAARHQRLSKLPRALRRACEMGHNRPLHFAGDELGISLVFLPLLYATSNDLGTTPGVAANKNYIPSFQLVGILGLPELDLARLGAPYCEWERIPITPRQRESILQQYDSDKLAQDFRPPQIPTDREEEARMYAAIRESGQQFHDLEGLYWIDESVLIPEVEKVERLRPLIDDIKKKRNRLKLETTPERNGRVATSWWDRFPNFKGAGGKPSPSNGAG